MCVVMTMGNAKNRLEVMVTPVVGHTTVVCVLKYLLVVHQVKRRRVTVMDHSMLTLLEIITITVTVVLTKACAVKNIF